MKRYCLTVELKNDPELIARYEAYHRDAWPEILQSLTDSGILSMQIYRLMTRMFMIIETSEDFSFERKSVMDAANLKVQEWEAIMGKFQQSLPGFDPEDPWKWKLMDKVFEFQG
jgi:L-rhamnose mutarotase